MKNNLKGITFLIWFIVSLILLFIVKTTGLLLIIIGQYFLVFGIIVTISQIKEKSWQPILFIIPVVGIGLLGSGLIMDYGTEAKIAEFLHMAPFILCGLFPLAGILFFIHKIALKRKCTYPIQARCINLKQSYERRDGISGKTAIFCPVYQIYYQGRYISICNEHYTNLNRTEIGSYYNLLIDPNNPNHFIRKSTQI